MAAAELYDFVEVNTNLSNHHEDIGRACMTIFFSLCKVASKDIHNIRRLTTEAPYKNESKMRLAWVYLFAAEELPHSNVYDIVQYHNEALNMLEDLRKGSGITGATWALWCCYYAGYSTKHDFAYAANILEAHLARDAGKDDPLARWFLASHYLSGKGRPKNYQKAAELLQQAETISPGGEEWSLELAFLYLKGLGVERNPQRAASYLQHSKLLRRSPQTKYTLGCCYLAGIGVPQDIEYGIALLKEVVEGGRQTAGAERLLQKLTVPSEE